MSPLPPPPGLPLLRLRAHAHDLVRQLLLRAPEWGHAGPAQQQVDGERAVSCYRQRADSFFLQVHWRWSDEGWRERDVTIVPGAVAALRLVLGDVDPAQITRLLGIAPTRAFGKGETGPHAARFRDEGLWIHEVLPHAFLYPEEKVAELLALLDGRPGWREVLRLPAVAWAGVTLHLRGCREQRGSFGADTAMVENLARLGLQFDLEWSVD